MRNLLLILFVLVLLGCVCCTPKVTKTDNYEYLRQIEQRYDSFLMCQKSAHTEHDTIYLEREKIVTLRDFDTVKVVEKINNGKIRYITKIDTVTKYVVKHSQKMDSYNIQSTKTETKSDNSIWRNLAIIFAFAGLLIFFFKSK